MKKHLLLAQSLIKIMPKLTYVTKPNGNVEITTDKLRLEISSSNSILREMYDDYQEKNKAWKPKKEDLYFFDMNDNVGVGDVSARVKGGGQISNIGIIQTYLVEIDKIIKEGLPILKHFRRENTKNFQLGSDTIVYIYSTGGRLNKNIHPNPLTEGYFMLKLGAVNENGKWLCYVATHAVFVAPDAKRDQATGLAAVLVPKGQLADLDEKISLSGLKRLIPEIKTRIDNFASHALDINNSFGTLK